MLCFLDVRSTYAKLTVDDRRVVEENMLFTFTRATFLDEFERLSGEFLREFLGIRYRRRRADELRFASVKFANSSQPPKHIRDVASKNAAVGVQLIQNHKLQIFK